MAVAVGIVAIPNAAAMIVPFEAWPYTNAPMFAADMSASTTYRMQLVLEEDVERPFEAVKVTRIPNRHYSRLLLISAYGSMDPSTPFGFVEGDTPDRFEARLDRFFDTTFRKARTKEIAGSRALRMQLLRVDTGEVHVVGRYDLATRTFTARRW